MDDVRNNTVPSKCQTAKCVISDDCQPNHIRIMFIGNSMTYHGIKKDIGWNNQCGMAASRKEKDYVHRLETMLFEKGIMIDKCIVNVADWERNYKNGDDVLKSGIYDDALKFNADIIILRFLENCPLDDFDEALFNKQLLKLIEYFDAQKHARIILTTSFWKHIGSRTIKQTANEMGLQCVEMSDLGERDEMKATGKFKHGGVAAHPGDLGMESMAKRLLPAVVDEIRKTGR